MPSRFADTMKFVTLCDRREAAEHECTDRPQGEDSHAGRLDKEPTRVLRIRATGTKKREDNNQIC